MRHTDRQMNRKIHRQTDSEINKHTDGRINKQTDGWMDGRTHGRTGLRIDGRANGQGRTHAHTHTHTGGRQQVLYTLKLNRAMITSQHCTCLHSMQCFICVLTVTHQACLVFPDASISMRFKDVCFTSSQSGPQTEKFTLKLYSRLVEDRP